jgi:transposase
LHAVGKKRAQRAYEAANNSVGCTEGSAAARMELNLLLEDYDAKLRQYEEIMATKRYMSMKYLDAAKSDSAAG